MARRPEEQVESLLTEKAFVFVPADAQTYTTAELDPGRYVAICFIPVGATPEALETGAAHHEANALFIRGVVAELERSAGRGRSMT